MNDDGTLSLGSDEAGHIFEFNWLPVAEGSGRFYHMSATLPSGATCYVSFNEDGSPLLNQCDPLSPQAMEDAKLSMTF